MVLNAYAATKAALEAHTLNPAAELAGRGVTANIFRPDSVDTAMQAWFRSQPPEDIGSTLHDYFQTSYEQGALIAPEHAARSLPRPTGRRCHGRNLGREGCLTGEHRCRAAQCGLARSKSVPTIKGDSHDRQTRTACPARGQA
jgi:hypothetical protein